MRAIDTNVILRFLLADDPAQFERATRVFEDGDVFVGTTVLLETEWVLRSAYRFSPVQVAGAFGQIAGIDGVTLEEADKVALAIAWMTEGLDFADALHLARSGNCDAFVTFDQKLAARAKTLKSVPVQLV